jgi:S-DNA-T family DNA segregation ATPase FtsK/SpoIIIE
MDELDDVVAVSGPADEGESAEPDSDAELTPMGRYRSATTDDPNFKWKQPPKSLLVRSPKAKKSNTADQTEIANRLVESLGHHGVVAEIVGTVSGPHITRFELKLAPGTKVSKVAQLRDDLAYALASTDIRILAPIPGKQAVGVEVPNEERQMVTLGDVWQAPPEGWSPLTVWLGKDVAGRSIGADLAKMPHLLVAGTTGAGKSGCVNAMLSSVLLRATPRDVKLVLVDPKQVELNHYESVPHLMTPVITNPRQAANALANLVREMEQRYALMAISRTRGLVELNESRERRGEPKLPYILCVIDELADLMMVAPTEVEDAIIRLAQKARAVGIHLVLATQSPRVDVITGMIKANVPSRIAFAVSSQTDSRVILDQNGAETLLGQGDMLFAPVGSSKLQRIQGAYIDEAQIAELCEYWRAQGEPTFNEELLEEVVDESGSGSDNDEFDPDEDALLEEAITLVAQMQTASTSMMQRRLRVGYTRAGRLIDMLERRGVISGYEGSKPRQVLITEADLPRVLAQLSSPEPAQAALDVGDDI